MPLETLGSSEEGTVKVTYHFGRIYQSEWFTCHEYRFRRTTKISESGYYLNKVCLSKENVPETKPTFLFPEIVKFLTSLKLQKFVPAIFSCQIAERYSHT
jgi:hypothetical protein